MVANRATGLVRNAARVGEGHDHDGGAPHIQGRTADRSSLIMISETEAAAVLAAYRRNGEWATVAELRRLFAGIQDNTMALQAGRMILARSSEGVKKRRRE